MCPRKRVAESISPSKSFEEEEKVLPSSFIRKLEPGLASYASEKIPWTTAAAAAALAQAMANNS